MERRYLKDGMRALLVLGCTQVERLRVGTDYHLTACGPDGPRLYLRTYPELADAILALAKRLNER